jgi:hypothetical protein
MPAPPYQIGLIYPTLGQLESPPTGGAGRLAWDRDHPMPERLGSPNDRPAHPLPLAQHAESKVRAQTIS